MNLAQKKIKILLSFIFGIAIFANSCRLAKEQSSQELLSEALVNLSGRNPDWKKAKVLAEKAVKADKNDFRAIILLAAAYEKTGRVGSATDQLKKAVKIAPDNFLAQFTLGRLYFETGKFDQALTHLVSANKAEPSNSTVLFYLAQTYQKLKQYKNAHGAYIKLCQLPDFRKRPEPYNELGVIYLQNKDLNNALKALIYAYRLDKENYKIVWNLAIFYDYYARNSSSAINFYDRYQYLTLVNPELAAKREIARQRVEVLRKVSVTR